MEAQWGYHLLEEKKTRLPNIHPNNEVSRSTHRSTQAHGNQTSRLYLCSEMQKVFCLPVFMWTLDWGTPIGNPEGDGGEGPSRGGPGVLELQFLISGCCYHV